MHSTQLHRFGRDQRGGTLILFAVFLLVLFGFAALCIDVGHVFEQQRRIQSGTDSAALAAVVLLTNAAPVKADAITEAMNIAAANGISSAEIAAGSIGEVEVGNWKSPTFTANATPLNAVRVTARRTVPLWFGRVIGFGQMTPGVRSVAVVTKLGSIPFGGSGLLIPYGLVYNDALTYKVGDIIDVATNGQGNWGKLDLCSKMSGRNEFIDHIVGGVDCTVSVGDSISSSTGNAGVDDGFNGRITSNPMVLIPLVDAFGNGNKDSVIQGFIMAELLYSNKNGSHWNGKIKILGAVLATTGDNGGSTGGQPFAWGRALVQ